MQITSYLLGFREMFGPVEALDPCQAGISVSTHIDCSLQTPHFLKYIMAADIAMVQNMLGKGQAFATDRFLDAKYDRIGSTALHVSAPAISMNRPQLIETLLNSTQLWITT